LKLDVVWIDGTIDGMTRFRYIRVDVYWLVCAGVINFPFSKTFADAGEVRTRKRWRFMRRQ
jgi:hypothetical protein